LFEIFGELILGEILMVNVGSTATGGKVVSVLKEGSVCKITLTSPVCTQVGNFGHFKIGEMEDGKC
jgi:translation initiation factor 2 gamma subunit (eIF-2gamma)